MAAHATYRLPGGGLATIVAVPVCALDGHHYLEYRLEERDATGGFLGIIAAGSRGFVEQAAIRRGALELDELELTPYARSTMTADERIDEAAAELEDELEREPAWVACAGCAHVQRVTMATLPGTCERCGSASIWTHDSEDEAEDYSERVLRRV